MKVLITKDIRSYKSPGLRTADFVYGWDDNPDFKRYLDDVRRIKSGQTPGIVGTDTGATFPYTVSGTWIYTACRKTWIQT